MEYFNVCSYRFTKVVVDPQVKALDGKAYDVLYIGTGIIIYLFNHL